MFRFSLHILFSFLFSSIIFAQSGADYLPSRIGSTWRYQRTTLDSSQRPIASTRTIETDSLAGTKLFGAIQAFVFRNRTNADRDSSIVSAHGDTVAFFNGGYPKEGVRLVSDSLGLGFLPQASGWYSYMKLKSPPVDNRADTLYRHDSTITVDGAEFRLVLLITRTRRSAPDASLTVPAGTFNTVTPFEITLTLNWMQWTPLGTRANPFLKLTTTYYVAPGNWIVKEVQNSTYFPLTKTDNDSIPSFTIPGYERLLEKMTPTSVDGRNGESARVPSLVTLAQNYPNPFNPSTTISFSLHAKSFVTLKVYNALGVEVVTLAEGEMPAGTHTRHWNAAGMPSGVYFYQLKAGSFAAIRKLVLMK